MSWRIIQDDVFAGLASLPAASVHCVVTSPPYWRLRDYGVAGQLGLEPTLDAYVATMGDVFDEVRRVLREDGTLWLNLGDTYANDGKWGGASSQRNRKYGPRTKATRRTRGKVWKCYCRRREPAGPGGARGLGRKAACSRRRDWL